MRLIALFALIVALAIPAQADTYQFRKYGFMFDGPAGWKVLSARDMKRFTDNTDYGSREINDYIRSRDPNLLLLIADTNSGFGVKPGIHIFVRDGRVDDPQAYVAAVADAMGQNVRNFRLIEGATPDQIGEYAATRFAAGYVVLSAGIRLDVVDVAWVVPLGDRHLLISSGTAPDDAKGIAEVRAAVETLRRVDD